MRLAVLGASGGVGTQVVAQATERAHEVVAIGRSSSQLPAATAEARGDHTDAAFLEGALAGADAVVCCLGLRIGGIAPWRRAEDPAFMSRAAPAIVAAMRAAGVARIVAVSAGGVGDSRAVTPLFFRVFIAVTALRVAYAELELFERTLLDSGLDACLARPGGLSDGPLTGQVDVVERLTAKPISRADVACWMLDQLDITPFAHRTPLIAAR